MQQARPKPFSLWIEPWLRTAYTLFWNSWVFFLLVLAAIVVGTFTFVTFMAAFGWIPVGGLAISIAGLPVQASQREIVGNFAFAGELVELTYNEIVDVVRSLLDCVEPLLVIWNFAVELLSSISRRVTEALNDITDGAFPVLFTWARFARMERLLAEEQLYTDAGVRADVLLSEARYRLPNMTASEQKYYIKWLDSEIETLPFKNANARSFTFPIEVFCNIIETILDFVLDVVDIVVEFALDIVDFIFDNFFDINEGIDGPFELILVQFILDTLLAELPFAVCFENIPWGLFQCLCPWVYENPFGFPTAGKEVPERVQNALIGCICVVEILGGSIDLESANGPIDLLIKCLGIDILINIFESFLEFVTTVLQPLYNALKVAFNILEAAFNGLLSAFDDLADLADDICDLLPGCKKKRSAADVELRADLGRAQEKLRELRLLFETGNAETMLQDHLRSTFEQHPRYQMLREKYDVHEDSVLGSRADIALRKVHAMNNTMSMWRDMLKENLKHTPPREKMARLVEGVNDAPVVKRFREHFRTKYGEDGHMHAKAIGDVIKNTTRIAAKALRTLDSETSLYHALGEIDWKGGVVAVRNLAATIRAANGNKPHPLRVRIEARVRFAIASVMGGERFPRVVREFTEKYGKDEPALYDGLHYVHRLYGNETSGIEAMMAAAQNGNELDLRIETIKMRVDEKRKETRSYREEIDNLEKMYKRSMEARDPFGVSVALAAHGMTTLSTAGYSVVSRLFGSSDDDSSSGATARIVPIGFGFVLAPLILLLQIFIMPILTILGEIVTSLIIRIAVGDEEASETYAFDFFSPFYYLLERTIEKAFVEGDGLSFQTVFDKLDESSDILLDQINVLAILFVRHYLCLIPQFVCPPKPPLSVQGRGVISVFDWIAEVIFCDPTHTCGEWDSTFNNAPCRCPQDPNIAQQSFYRDISDIPKQRYARPGDPCNYPNGAPRGKQICYPFAPLGNDVSNLQVDINADPKCDTEYGYAVDNVLWSNAPSVWAWLGAILSDTLITLRYIIRFVFAGWWWDWRLLLVALVIIAIPSPCFLPIGSGLAFLTVLVNVGSLLTTWIGDGVQRNARFNEGRFLVGGAFKFVLDNIFFQCGDKDENQFGRPCPGETQCTIQNIFSPLVVLFGSMLIFGFVFHFLFPVGIVALFWGFVNIILLLLYIPFLFFWMLFLSIYFSHKNVGRTSVVFINDKMQEHPIVHIGSGKKGERAAHVLNEHNIKPTQRPVHIPFSNQIVVRTSEPFSQSRMSTLHHGITTAARSVWGILKHRKMEFISDAFRNAPAQGVPEVLRDEPAPANTVLAYSYECPGTGFPYLKYIVDEQNVPLLASRRYRVLDHDNYYDK